MIQRTRIRNFRALRDVDVQLRPLTVLLGPNDSGKSSFLDAILRASKNTVSREDWWRGAEHAEVELWAEDRQLVPATGFFTAPPELSTELFKLPSDGIRMESQGVQENLESGAPALQSDGRNLAGYLDYLLRKDRRRFDEIGLALGDRIPGLGEISIITPHAASRALTFSIDGGYGIPGERLSTGVRMLFFFVALAYHPDPPALVLIEEPENGVHPKRLKDIVELLRGMIQGTLSGRATQVILSTHSPYLLDHIRLPEDQVIVFRREPDGRRTATEVDEKRLKTFLDEFMLGEVWFNQGEEGLVSTTR